MAVERDALRYSKRLREADESVQLWTGPEDIGHEPTVTSYCTEQHVDTLVMDEATDKADAEWS